MALIGTADFSIVIGDGSTVFWFTDDHVQEALTLCRTDYQFVQMTPVPEQIAGTLLYKDYYLPNQNWEESTSGSAYWLVTDSIGSAIGTANYTPDYIKGIVRFTADQGGSVRMITGKSYNLNCAAADIWRQKGANAASFFDFASDDQSFKKGQFFDHCMKMASFYENEAGVQVSQFFRDDLMPNVGGWGNN